MTCLPHSSSERTQLLWTGSQSLGTRVVLQSVPGDGAPVPCSLEGLEGVSHPAPRPTTTVPAADPWRGVLI